MNRSGVILFFFLNAIFFAWSYFDFCKRLRVTISYRIPSAVDITFSEIWFSSYFENHNVTIDFYKNDLSTHTLVKSKKTLEGILKE